MEFAILRREGVSARSRKAAMAALSDANRALAEYDKLIDKALEDSRLSKRSKRFLKSQWYGDPRERDLSLGNRAVLRASMAASIIVLLTHAQKYPTSRKGRKRFRMVTTSPDLGVTSFNEPIINLAALGGHFDRAVRAAEIDAVGFLDIAVLDDRTSVRPLMIAMHMHGAMRARTNEFRAKVAQRLASPNQRPLNQFGFDVVKIRGKKRDWGKPLSRRDVSGLGYYCPKPSCGLTACYLTNDGDSRSKSTLQGWNTVHVLRQLELYSHCDALRTTRGVGRGRFWRRKWKATLLRLLKIPDSGRGRSINHEQLGLEWQRIWLELGVPGMVAVKVIGPNR